VIILKSSREIELIHAGGRILAEAQEMLRDLVKPGVSTKEIDFEIEELIRKRGACPAFKGYRGFPATVCVSINEEVVHGIPSPHRRLKEGDIVGLDLGCIVDGYYADTAITLPVGEIPPPVQRLLDVTRESLDEGIARARPGHRLGDISHAIQRHVEGADHRQAAATGSAGRSTRTPRSPTLASRAAGRSSRRGCASPSSPWSPWGPGT